MALSRDSLAKMLRFLVMVVIVGLCACQNCKPSGEWCSDEELCCGGCCTHNICIETYRDCRVLEDPCAEHYCPEGSICYTFKPETCKMCEIQAECRFVDNLSFNNEFRGEFPQVSASYATRSPCALLSISSLFVFLF